MSKKKGQEKSRSKRSKTKTKTAYSSSFEFTFTDEDSYELIDSFLGSDNEFKDRYQTQEQKKRDIQISSLLKHYVSAYSDKTKFQRRCRIALVSISFSVVSFFALAFLLLLLHFGFTASSLETEGVVSLISICISFLAAIIGIMQIVAKYCFPENDEQYITKIVEAIQKNDLDNKKENIRVATSNEYNNKLNAEEDSKSLV